MGVHHVGLRCGVESDGEEVCGMGGKKERAVVAAAGGRRGRLPQPSPRPHPTPISLSTRRFYLQIRQHDQAPHVGAQQGGLGGKGDDPQADEPAHC